MKRTYQPSKRKRNKK